MRLAILAFFLSLPARAQDFQSLYEAAEIVWPKLNPAIGRPSKNSPEFKIVCDLDGHHDPSDTQRPQPPHQEHRLLKGLLANVYPKLPKELQETASQVSFVANHRQTGMGRRYFGWSAEDDPDYRYPRVDFGVNGGITINFSPSFIHNLQILERSAANGDKILGSGLPGLEAIAGHEIMHAFQYQKKPLRDLLRAQAPCPEGLCDEALIAETKLKMDYEEEAYRFEETLNPGAMATWQAEKPDYATQYILPEIVWALTRLRDDATSEASELFKRWEARMGAKKDKIFGAYPYLTKVEQRYLKEKARFRLGEDLRLTP